MKRILFAMAIVVLALSGARPAEARTDVSIDFFYDSLGSGGSWVELGDYGYCWQPSVAVIQRDWRPYCDRGRWLYSDCGYYWQSDYSWGWHARQPLRDDVAPGS